MSIQLEIDTNALSTFTDGGSDAPDQAAKFLKSIAHRDRLKVLCGLLEGEQSVAAIEQKVGASQSAISQHLGKLKDEGIVQARREGRQIFYSISDPTVLSVIEILYLRFCAEEDPAESV
ncbi:MULTISPECIES: ArsR/SmtB family transcription factor [Halocynthiibacter]|uniref:Metalloregulator ArsR/SmtB family transcription factor n=1 Tax=Halocynthiibacter halioticoli TaxID=2986804 RepID=A0AAE3IZH6_9RHOB|nr:MULTISPECIES: metalloregulator ArsR/SmtB family transcription factor [Halocynthiibacter]MCV6823970.1 metalloregulator ArsR/SmtB family transcription factor [Halocynthiibacter halioticoli]MCW4056971.1 metalloregulator ArsR/SmtB family transcription factor [Halocynthiibacter sp. SDUM655004]